MGNPPRNAFSGYSYQKEVTFLLLAMMDVERNISKIEIEAKTKDNFDDLIITKNSEFFHFQIKDLSKVSVEKLIIQNNAISINGTPHKLSPHHNVIFFKDISIIPNDRFLGFPCYKLNPNVSIVSLNRIQINEQLDSFFLNNLQRKNALNHFFNSILDKRIWEIPIESLPQLKIFITELQEKSVLISHKILEFDSLLFIEGKPGIGKSHFVNTLVKEYDNNVLYRFWIGNQDNNYKERLRFMNFIRDLNTNLFYDQKKRSHQAIFIKLKEEEKTLIIDGLDHVENYNKSEFENFIKFINSAKSFCKIIVLSRPLTQELPWKKHTLENWNRKQTEKVLKKIFHLSEYSILNEIFRISQGYPIIVKYLAEHYKLHRLIPCIEEIENIDSYYHSIISNEKGKQSLSLFLCSNSYIMESEIELFISDEKYTVEEFIKEHPYLFDIKLNRISLLHDSFNTYLRNHVHYSHRLNKVNIIVSESILSLQKRFLSRFSFFQLPLEKKKEILIKYASIDVFRQIKKSNIDYEAIKSFYHQLRDFLKEIPANQLTVNQYYDLSLIFSLLTRDHLSTLNTFYYTYVQSLIANGITDECITSSAYLFGMYYYVKTKNAILLYNETSNNHYDTEHFYNKLEIEIKEEEDYINKHTLEVNKTNIDKALKDRINLKNNLVHIIENIYINQLNIEDYSVLKNSLDKYLTGNTYEAHYMLRQFLEKHDAPTYYSDWIFRDVYHNLYSYGYKIKNRKNEYQDLTLKEFIHKFSYLGSFDFGTKIHNYIRLALLENRTIDIESIDLYWTKYYNRKDYTLYSIPIALNTLYIEGFIDLKECVKLINTIQSLSEKGYRHLLSEFIEFFSPKKIITSLESNFEIEDLQIKWFLLPSSFINEISKETYNIEENKLLKYHRNLSIPLEEIENVLFSNKKKELEDTLDLFNMEVSYKESQKETIPKFNLPKIKFQKLEEEENNFISQQKNSQQRFEEGILSYEDLNFIKKEKLKPSEIAKYSDGYYTSIPEIKIFQIYSNKQINQSFKNILYNSLTSKTKSINYFYSLFYHPGNILTMIKLYRNDKEFKVAIKSFEKFIHLSSLNLELKK